jgi:hypothetical protein
MLAKFARVGGGLLEVGLRSEGSTILSHRWKTASRESVGIVGLEVNCGCGAGAADWA